MIKFMFYKKIKLIYLKPQVEKNFSELIPNSLIFYKSMFYFKKITFLLVL